MAVRWSRCISQEISTFGFVPTPSVNKRKGSTTMNKTESWQDREKDTLVRLFLRELDACKTEDERIAKVMELVYGIVKSANREYERRGHE